MMDRIASRNWMEDKLAKTVRKGASLSAYKLAEWFAGNWWRLLWEPERKTFSWKMSHAKKGRRKGDPYPEIIQA